MSFDLSGLNCILQETCSVPAIDDDLEAEAASNSPDSWDALATTADVGGAIAGSIITNIVDEVSQTVCDNTDKEYRRYESSYLYFPFAAHGWLTASQMAVFEAWLVERDFIPQGADVFGETIPSNMPYLIAAWIMSK